MEVGSTFTGRIYEDWMRGVQDEKIAGILERLKPKDRVLDVGCGAGFLEAFIPEIYALDIDYENLKKADGIKIRASGEYLPFESSSFGAVFCIDVVHLLGWVKELMRVLVEEGVLILTSFCSEYNKWERLGELRELVKGMRVKQEFFVGSRELDAVVVATKE